MSVRSRRTGPWLPEGGRGSLLVLLRPATRVDVMASILSEVESVYAAEIVRMSSIDATIASEIASRAVRSIVDAPATRHQFGHVSRSVNSDHVGIYWWSIDKEIEMARLQYIAIHPRFRRRGFASAAIAAIHEAVLEHDVQSIGLNVFGSNTAALALYASCGYEIDSHEMICPLRRSTPQETG